MKNIIILLFLSISIVTYSQIIVIDPGHGYGENGENKDSRTWEEISTACEVGLKLKKLLTNAGYTAYITRNHSGNGSWISVTQRALMAENWDADRLLSIHCNGGGGTGTETFYCSRNTADINVDIAWAQKVQAKMVIGGEWRNRRCVEDYPFIGFHLGVLSGATPGCLNEIGFVDYPADLTKLLDNVWRDKFAQAYFDAIKENIAVINPPSENSTIEIYPNPSKAVFNIAFENSYTGNIQMQVFNSSGVLVQEITMSKSIPQFASSLNLNDLPKGIYFLQIRIDDEWITQSIAIY